MGFSLSPETQRLIEERAAAAGYTSVEEYLLAATEFGLAPLDDELLEAIDEAEDQAERGEVTPWEDFEKEVRAKYLNK